MSIHAIHGTPGAGKSYLGTLRAKEALEGGRSVITNLPLNLDNEFWKPFVENGPGSNKPALKVVAGFGRRDHDDEEHFGNVEFWKNELFPSDRRYHVTDEDGHVQGPMIIIDEAAGTFDPVIRQKRKNEDWHTMVEFFQIHRHHSIDIILLYLTHTAADAEIKGLIERWHKMVNTKEMTGLNTYSMKTSAKGFVQGTGAYINQATGTYKKDVFELYDSHAEGSAAGKDAVSTGAGLLRGKALWKRWWFILLVACCVMLPWFMYRTYQGIRGTTDRDSDIEWQAGGTLQAPQEIVPGIAVPNALPPDKPHLLSSSITGTLPPGFPAIDVPMIGFDSRTVYFSNGQQLERDVHFQPYGLRVIMAEPCRLEIVELDPPKEARPLRIVYTCSKGF